MSYILSVDNQNYYFESETLRNEAEAAVKEAGSNDTKRAEAIQKYVDDKKCAKNEDDLAELDSSEKADDTDKTSNTKSKSAADGAKKYTIKYDDLETAAENMKKEVGVNNLNENSDLDDIISTYDKIEKKVLALESKIDTLDTTNPENIDEIFKEFSSVTSAFANIASMAGVDIESAFAEAKEQNNLLIWGGAGVAAAGIAGTIAVAAGASSTIPVAGWAVGAVLGLVALGFGIYSAVETSKQEEKMKQLKSDIEDLDSKLVSDQEEVISKVQEDAGELVETANDELDGLLGFQFEFKDIKDTDSILENINKLINWQTKLQPYLQLSNKYGLEIDGLTDIMNKLGNEDNPLTQAQNYINSYATTAQIKLNGQAVKDTEELNAFYKDVTALKDAAKEKGLNTMMLDQMLTKMQTMNLSSVDTTSSNLLNKYSIPNSSSSISDGTSVVSDISSLFSGSDEAIDTSDGVIDNSSQYTTSTDKLTGASEELEAQAQAIADDYAEKISALDGLSVEELNQVMLEAQETVGELEDFSDRLDTSKIQAVADSIPEKQQEVIQAEMDEIIGKAAGTNSGTDIQGYLDQIDEKIETYGGLQVDTSKLESAKETIISTQQEYLETTASEVASKASQMTKGSEGQPLVQGLEEIIPENEAFADISCLENAITTVREKAQELLETSANEAVSKASQMTKSSEGQPIIQALQEEISENQSFANVSCLQNAIATVQAKMQELFKQEEQERIAQEQAEEDANKKVEEKNSNAPENADVQNTNSGSQTPVNIVYDDTQAKIQDEENSEENNEETADASPAFIPDDSIISNMFNKDVEIDTGEKDIEA